MKIPHYPEADGEVTMKANKLLEPVEDVDYFVIKRVKYELHVEGTAFVTADEGCDDFDLDPNKIAWGSPMIVGKMVVGSEERCIYDPTKSFDREAWMQAKRE